MSKGVTGEKAARRSACIVFNIAVARGEAAGSYGDGVLRTLVVGGETARLSGGGVFSNAVTRIFFMRRWLEQSGGRGEGCQAIRRRCPAQSDGQGKDLEAFRHRCLDILVAGEKAARRSGGSALSEAVVWREASRRYGDGVLRNSVVDGETVWLSGDGVLSKAVAGASLRRILPTVS